VKVVEKNIASHVRGIDDLDLKINVLPDSMVEIAKALRFADNKRGQYASPNAEIQHINV
jgi:hypothetical protein